MDVTTDVDEIWESLGKFGKYQRFQIFIQLLDIIPCAFHLLSIVFIGFKPSYQCAEVDNDFIKTEPLYMNDSIYIHYDKCQVNFHLNDTNSTFIRSQDCVNGHTYPVPKDRTFVTELDLVCERAGLSELSQTLIMIGQAFGAAIFTSLADRYGRKPIHVFCHIGLFGITLGLAFIQSYTAFAVLRFFVGGLGLTSAILMIEMLPMQSRYIPECLGLTTWTTGVCLVAVFGYFMRNLSWRYMQIALAIKAARWNRVKYEDVMKRVTEKKFMKEVVVKLDMSQQNKDSPDLIPDKSHSELTNGDNAQVTDSDTNKEVMKSQHYSFITILKKKTLLFNSLILWYMWIGRRKLCIIFHGIAGTSLIIATVVTTLSAGQVALATVSTVFTLIGKYAITGSFSTIFLYTPELYPTNLRNAGIGFSSAAARSGGMLAPFAGTLAEQVIWAPGAIFGIMCLIVTFLATFLPETKGHELPQTVEALNEWYKTHRRGLNKEKKEIEENGKSSSPFECVQMRSDLYTKN
ncbi:hypothetical protein KUTeg_018022, partial [Tegillarca granosa]